MSAPRVGFVGGEALDDVVAAMGDRCEAVRLDPSPAGIASANVEAMCVVAGGVSPPVLQAVRDGHVPALFLAEHAAARSWLRVIRKGVHDVAWLPLDVDEVRARLLGMLARKGAWNQVTAALCREVAHDMRGPLQALSFTVAALQNDGAVADGFSEDVDALLEATDKADLMLNGVSNLGRHAVPVKDDAPILDLGQLVRKAGARKAFGDRIQVEGNEPLPVRADKSALSSAVEDVIRVAWIRSAGRQPVRVQCLRFGDEGVLTAQARAYDALLEHLPALLWRERPILLRRDRVPMPLAGLAYAREVARAVGGDLTVRRIDNELQVELRLPLA